MLYAWKSEGPLFSLLKLSLTRRWASLSTVGTSVSFSIIIQLIYQIFKTVDLYQNNVLEHSVRAKTDDNVIDDFADVFGSESLNCFDVLLSSKLTAAHQCSIV